MKKKDLILSYMQRTVSIADKEKFFTTQELVDHYHLYLISWLRTIN